MAVVNTKSTAITNMDATPAAMNSAQLAGNAPSFPVGLVEVAAADTDASVYRFFRVHSSDRVAHLLLLNDAITAGTSYDFGLYDTAANGGALVDVDFFASAVDLSSARVAPLDIVTEAQDIDKAEKAIWEILGLSADPQKYYDVCALANTVGSAAGTIVLKGTVLSNRN